MKLSDDEKKIVEHMRKRDASLVRWRWPLLLMGILILALDLHLVLQFIQTLRKPDLNSVLVIAISGPWILFSGGFASVLIGYLTRCWNGNKERQLFLKIIDELEKRG